MTSALVVVDDHVQDSAARTLARVLAARGPAEMLKLSVFLKRVGVSADADQGTLRFDSDFARAQLFGVRLYNRVVRVSPESASAVDGGRQTIPTAFVSAAYAAVLESCTDVMGQPGLGSPVGDILPLNLQWRRVDAVLAGCGTPRFDFGVGMQPVDVSSFRKPIYKSPVDPYDWNSLATGTAPAANAFVVDRPSGNAMIVWFVGTQCDVFPLGSSAELPAAMREELTSYAPVLQRTFKAFMGEALFFVAPGATTFGAFSHHLRTASKRRSFGEVVERAVT